MDISGANMMQSSVLAGQNDRLAQLRSEYLNPQGQDKVKLKKAAQEFESVFIQQLLDTMDQTVDREDSVMGGGSAEEYFRGMLNQEVASSISTRPGGSGFGLAETIYRQMANQMSVEHKGPVIGDQLAPVKTNPLGAPAVNQSNEVSQ